MAAPFVVLALFKGIFAFRMYLKSISLKANVMNEIARLCEQICPRDSVSGTPGRHLRSFCTSSQYRSGTP